MAWPATDFTSRPFDKVASDLSALWLALNEREAALGQTETRCTIPLKTWTDGTAYKIGDAVTGTDSNIYLAKTNHTASSTNKPITGASYATNWAKEDGATWAISTSYAVEDRVIGTDSNVYRCITTHTSTNNNKPITGADYSDNWILGTGRKARPLTVDLSGLVLGNNGDTDDLISIIVEVQDAAKSLVEDNASEKFTTTSGGSTEWTHNSLITDINITDNTGSIDFTTTFDWWDSHVWERLRQYLDELIYCVIRADKHSFSGTQRLGSQFGPGGDADTNFEAAWDSVKAASGTSESIFGISWEMLYEGFTKFTGRIQDDTNVVYDTEKYSGSLIGDGVLTWSEQARSTNQEIDYSVDSSTGNNYSGDIPDTGSGNSINTIITKTDLDITIVANLELDLSFDSSEPANAPFWRQTSAAEGDGTVVPTEVKFWLDISGELTDQA
jgi:hypothetical protein